MLRSKLLLTLLPFSNGHSFPAKPGMETSIGTSGCKATLLRRVSKSNECWPNSIWSAEPNQHTDRFDCNDDNSVSVTGNCAGLFICGNGATTMCHGDRGHWVQCTCTASPCSRNPYSVFHQQKMHLPCPPAMPFPPFPPPHPSRAKSAAPKAVVPKAADSSPPPPKRSTLSAGRSVAPPVPRTSHPPPHPPGAKRPSSLLSNRSTLAAGKSGGTPIPNKASHPLQRPNCTDQDSIIAKSQMPLLKMHARCGDVAHVCKTAPTESLVRFVNWACCQTCRRASIGASRTAATAIIPAPPKATSAASSAQLKFGSWSSNP